MSHPLDTGASMGPNHTSLWGRFDPAPLPCPGLSPEPAWGPQGPRPPSLPTGGSRLRRFSLTVKGEYPVGLPWVALSAGAPSWGGRVLSGIRATREAAGRQATCKTGSAGLRRSALERSKPGSGGLGGRLTSSWRASLPPEEGLGKAARPSLLCQPICQPGQPSWLLLVRGQSGGLTGLSWGRGTGLGCLRV